MTTVKDCARHPTHEGAGTYEGIPVRNPELCERFFREVEDLGKNQIEAAIAAGIPEDVATSIIHECKLANKQAILGRANNERPAFFPAKDWDLVLKQRNTKPKISKQSLRER